SRLPFLHRGGCFFRSRFSRRGPSRRHSHDSIERRFIGLTPRSRGPSGRGRAPWLWRWPARDCPIKHSPYGGGRMTKQLSPLVALSLFCLAIGAAPARAQWGAPPPGGACRPPVHVTCAPCEDSGCRPGLLARIRDRLRGLTGRCPPCEA